MARQILVSIALLSLRLRAERQCDPNSKTTNCCEHCFRQKCLFMPSQFAIDHGCGACSQSDNVACRQGMTGFEPLRGAEEQKLAQDGLVAGLTACSALEAAIEVHIRHFHQQQEEERRFLKRLPEVCAVPPEGYFKALHELRKPMMAAINRHVRGAFFVKAACTSTAFEIAPEVQESGKCNPPVLEHEPFNIIEGFYVVNLTNHLLRSGPAFCDSLETQPLRRWKTELEYVMEQHRSNKAFDYLWDQFQDTCDDLLLVNAPRVHSMVRQVSTLQCNTTVEELGKLRGNRKEDRTCATLRRDSPTREQMDAAIDREVRAPTKCMCPSMILNNERKSCTHDVIDIVGNDTLALLETVRRSLVPVFAEACPEASEARSAALARLYRTTASRRKKYSPDASSIYTGFTLDSVYHKIVPYCGSQAQNPGGSSICAGNEDNAGSSNAQVMDLIPAADADRCGADSCPAAARAVDSYHRMLGVITPLRTALLGLIFDGDFEGIVGREGTAVFQAFREKLSVALASTDEKCSPRLEMLVDSALELTGLLNDALDQLRSTAEALDVTCVADRRKATVYLNHGVSRELAELMNTVINERLFRDGGGLPITVRVSKVSRTAVTTKLRDWTPMRPRRHAPVGFGAGGFDAEAHLTRIFLLVGSVGILSMLTVAGVVFQRGKRRRRWVNPSIKFISERASPGLYA